MSPLHMPYKRKEKPVEEVSQKRIIKIRVFDHEGAEWEGRIKWVNKLLQQVHPDVEFQFTITPSVFKGIAWRSKKLHKSEKSGEWVMRWLPDYSWFMWNFTIYSWGYNTVVANFSPTQFGKPENGLSGESLRFNFGIGEIVTSGKSDKAWAELFLHEYSHTLFDHIMKVPDVTHKVHYTDGLKALLKLWQL